MIEVKSLTKKYNSFNALDDVSFTFSKGVLGLLGPNGAGKTTFMRILATLLAPSSGDIFVNGKPLTKEANHIRSSVGYLPQHFHVYPQVTAYEFLNYIAVMKGVKNKKVRREHIMHVLEEVNLLPKANEKVKTYSHGMKQRIGIAQALIGDPTLLIFDEPTVGLDPEERLRFRNLISKVSDEKCVLLSTHVVSDIESSCHDLVVLNKGKKVFGGTVADLKEKARCKVWEVPVKSTSDSLGYTVLQMKEENGQLFVYLLADEKPYQYAKAIEPTLEDGYMDLLEELK
ncbi:ABC transporter ATP-binding protein [Bacillus sp. FJAT-45066]|uniref:ABC transporter ATP-binding protein n=1 Tax=Bacillus sp. FJAT-45066 TaxID=2011010 RepID=UPI000BB7417E|nr:ABC transporter ATP-binding protein [Bacillus sp. FJAT-45066]